MSKLMFFFSAQRAKELHEEGFRCLGRCRLFCGSGEFQYTFAIPVSEVGQDDEYKKYKDCQTLGVGEKISEHMTEIPLKAEVED